MPAEKSPAYQWYVKDWRSSRATQRMSFAEKGVYREMLDEQWERGALPDDPKEVAALIATTAEQEAEVLSAWQTVRRKFITVDDGIINERLEAVRLEKRRYRKTARKGGLARAQQAQRTAAGTFQPTASKPPAHKPAASPATSPAEEPASEPATNQQVHQHKSSTATATATATATEKEQKREIARACASAPERITDAYRSHWKSAYGHECTLIVKPLEYMQLEQQIEKVGEGKLLQAMRAYFASVDAYVQNAKHPLAMFLRDPMRYLANGSTRSERPARCKHQPPCKDDVEHTSRDLAERRAV